MAAKPLQLQRLEASLDMGNFMQYAHDVLSRPLSDSEESSPEFNDSTDKLIHGVVTSKSDRISDKIRVYNFSNVGQNRKWLQDVLLSDTDSELEMSEDEYIRDMLRTHAQEERLRNKYYRQYTNIQYGYYGAGLLSNYDMFPEHQRTVMGGSSKKMRKVTGLKEKRPYRKSQKYAKSDTEDMDFDFDPIDGYDLDDPDFDSRPSSPRSKRKKAPEALAARRRKVWQLMAKKEIGKVQRARANNHKEVVTNCKKVATLCMKVCRQKAMQSQKNMRETVWRAKRLTREMLSYWKRYDRVERETRRRLEKEAEEQRKMDVEKIEVKRQQRKLNFLITQTELYAHFMSKKLCGTGEEEEVRILSQLDEEVIPRLASLDDYNSEAMKQQAQKNASEAFNVEQERTGQFNVLQKNRLLSADELVDELPQPKIFKGMLKGYQLKGMTWLANLYNQGISGILADEMGLGKTVQSIAFLCHIAEQYGVWGPFLIISPASTLHNWQQEMQRFVKDFKVVPYWGSPNERKILRQFWEQKDLHTKDASFHVVITSYQIVVSDYKYFNRIKWQYMVLDEAQAIKSSSSVRWKLLLGFNCRNRLLLSGTPIQNSMAELWSLLHFIMPTLFDSHEEFNEWFSKDIESHAENKTGIDEKQISRLHMILKPFMLRRIKKDVENELSDKIEIMVYCPLTTRQKLLYTALKKKIRIEDLLKMTGSGAGGSSEASLDKNFTSNLMNLVMQFRKVCNHPELFERRDVRSPFAVRTEEFVMPRLVFDEGILATRFPRKDHLIYNKFNVFKAENVHRSLFPKDNRSKLVDYTKRIELVSAFSFARFCDLSPGELEKLKVLGLIYSINHCRSTLEKLVLLHHQRNYQPETKNLKAMLLEPTIEAKLNPQFLEKMCVLKQFLFLTRTSTIYGHHKHSICPMQETMEHRIIRSKHRLQKVKIEEIAIPLKPEGLLKSPGKNQLEPNPSMILVDEFPHVPLPPRDIDCAPTEMPTFVYNIPPKVHASGRRLYCEHRGAQWEAIRHEQCENAMGKALVYSSMAVARPRFGWSFITIPDKQTLVSDCGKLAVLDSLLTRLKSQGHRVLIYSQMTKMIDLLEEYMWHRKHRYMRLDGSSKISARRDMVADFQNRADIFVFLLSTRAGGLGINLTAADTVIFYDSDWNPTVDQQAMDRAHRLGQTKQVTVYRLICKGTIEERILQRAREKSEIQRMVISGGNFKPDTLKPKEVVSLLLDDDEIESKFRQKTDDGPGIDEPSGSPGTTTTMGPAGSNRPTADKDRDRKRKANATASGTKSMATGDGRHSDTSKKKTSSLASSSRTTIDTLLHLNEASAALSTAAAAAASGAPIQMGSTGGVTPSSSLSEQSYGSSARLTVDATLFGDDDVSSNDEALVVDYESPKCSPGPFNINAAAVQKPKRKRPSRAGGGSATKRGRPKTAPKGGLGELLENLGQLEAAAVDATTTTRGKKGPGRPKAKAGSSTGFKSAPRIRKPAAPLVVPLGQSPAPTPPGPSPAMSPAPSPAPPERGLGFYQPMNEDV